MCGLHGSQQRVEEKESILKQFAELLQQKNKLDELQKPFDEELQHIRSEIDKFGERRAEITVSIDLN